MACILVVIGASGLNASAQTHPTTSDSSPESSELFPKGLTAIELTGGYITRGNRHLTYGTVGYGHYLANRLEIRPEIVGYYGSQSTEPALMIGLTLEGRLHFLEVGKMSLFGEIGGGILEGNNDFPPQGTKFNFTYQAGLGVSYHISQKIDLLARASFLHISNAFIDGRDRNPAFNGFGGYIGLMWRL
jgi:hypothetical protein